MSIQYKKYDFTLLLPTMMNVMGLSWHIEMAVISLSIKLSKIIVYSSSLAVVLLLSIKSLNRGQKFTYPLGLCDPELDPGVTRSLSM